MSDVEEGEIEGELGAEPATHQLVEQQPEEATEPVVPREQVWAPKPCGRAPYFADPNEGDGFRGRGGGGKKQKKKDKRKSGAAAQAAAAGFVDVYGQGACAEVELYPDVGPIRLSDVQNLLLWVLGEGTNPRWCFVKNKPLVSRVLLLVAHGVDRATWEAHGAELLPAWRRHLGAPAELQARNATLAPGQTVHTLLTVPQTRKRRREEEEERAQQAGGEEEAPPPPPPPQAEQAAAAAAAASPAAALVAASGKAAGGEAAGAEDMETDVVHGGAPASLSGAAAAPAAVDAAAVRGGEEAPGATAAGSGAPAKRMKLAPADDVSSRVKPQLGAPAGTAGTAAAVGATGTHSSAADASNGAAAPRAEQGRPHQRDPAAALPVAHATGPRRRCVLPPSHYVLTLDQLQEHKYPLPQFEEVAGEMVCPAGFVATQACKGTPQHDLVALDCEMCITEEGFELTRATLVDREGKVLLDELVVPRNPITDHNTRYSGITADMLEGVTTRLEDVRQRIRGLVSAETILVAHSGDNDLHALKLIHANVVDTSVLFPHPRGPPFKSALRVLASRHLLRTIQQGEHNPVEDARAAMDLALLKFERGPAYAAGAGERGDRLIEVLGEAGRRSVMVDRLEVLNRHVVGNCSAVAAEGDAAGVAQLCKELRRPQVHFLWGQLTALQQFYEDRLAAARASGLPEPSALYQADGAATAGTGSEQQQQEEAPKPSPPPPQLPQQEGQPNGLPPQQQEQQALPQSADEPKDGGQQQQQENQHSPTQQQQQADGEHAGAQQADEQQGGELGGQPVDWRARQAAALSSLDASLAQLWEAAPAGTLVVVVTGQGDTAYSRYLQEQKWRRQQGLDGQPPWSTACEAHLAAVQDRALCALCFAAIKRAGPPAGAAAAAQQQEKAG